MTRSILAGLAFVAGIVAVTGTGCQSTGVGDPCTPEQEYQSTFAGFTLEEVGTEGESFQCQTRLCLVNHFQGRVSCPYGQGKNGSAPGIDGAKACVTPGGLKVTGPDMANDATVRPQCSDRTADKTVYCSCRCADIDGTQNNGNFCTCPDGFQCTQLVNSTSANADQGLTGGYCIKTGTQYGGNSADGQANSCVGTCGSTGTADCGKAQGVGG